MFFSMALYRMAEQDSLRGSELAGQGRVPWLLPRADTPESGRNKNRTSIRRSAEHVYRRAAFSFLGEKPYGALGMVGVCVSSTWGLHDGF
jgi:hypothetical protein